MYCCHSAAFNYNHPDTVNLRVVSIPPSINGSFPSRRSAAPTILPVVIPPLDPPSSYQTMQVIPNHPFSARSLDDDLTFQVDHWPRRPKYARRGESVDSATVNSIRDVVIQVASKGSRAPVTRQVFPPPTSMRNPSSRSLDAGDSCQLQQILPDQTKYAERFELELPRKPARPRILVNTNSPALRSWPSAEPMTARSPRSPSSVVYGSDIIRVGRQSSVTRRSSRSAAATSGLRHSYLASSPRDTLGSSPSQFSQRYSWAASKEELPVLYETSTDGSSKPRLPTFGEQSFLDVSITAPPSRASTGLPSVPRAGPSGLKTRGPRLPPPPDPLSADGRYLAPTLPLEGGRRRSGTLPFDSEPTTYLNSERF